MRWPTCDFQSVHHLSAKPFSPSASFRQMEAPATHSDGGLHRTPPRNADRAAMRRYYRHRVLIAAENCSCGVANLKFVFRVAAMSPKRYKYARNNDISTLIFTLRLTQRCRPEIITHLAKCNICERAFCLTER